MFETQQNREAEAAGLQRLADAMGCKVKQTDSLERWDGTLFRGDRVAALAEYKEKGKVYGGLGTDGYNGGSLYLDLSKWVTLTNFELSQLLPAYYMVELKLGDYLVRIGELMPMDLSIEMKGRKDRPDAVNDICPTVRIPFKFFMPLKDYFTVYGDDDFPSKAQQEEWMF